MPNRVCVCLYSKSSIMDKNFYYHHIRPCSLQHCQHIHQVKEGGETPAGLVDKQKGGKIDDAQLGKIVGKSKEIKIKKHVVPSTKRFERRLKGCAIFALIRLD